MDKVAKNQGLFISKPRNAKAAGRVRSNTSPTVKSMSMAAPRRFAWFDALVIWGPRYSVLGNTAVTNWNTFYILSIGIHFFWGVTSHWSQGTGYLTSSREYFKEIPILSWWAMRKIIINVFLFHRVCWYWRNKFPILYLHTGIANMTFVTNCM